LIFCSKKAGFILATFLQSRKFDFWWVGMELSRSSLIFQNGERFSLLINENGVPDFWTTLYLTTFYRSSMLETMRSVSNVLAHFKIWDNAQPLTFFNKVLKITEDSRSKTTDNLQRPLFIDVAEAQSLARHCKLRTVAARRRLAKTMHGTVKELQSAHPIEVLPDATVSVKQQRHRLRIISDFLCFVVETALRKRPHFAFYLDSADNMKKLLLKQKPKRQGSRASQNDPDKKAPPPEVFDEVMRLADPECPENPFSTLVRQRNYLLFRVLYETGMRAGEILQLKVPDIHFSEQLISVVRRHDDPEDKWRSFEPNAKTQERDIPISYELSQALYNYIIDERRLLASTKKHGFLFVSNKGPSRGAPMSLSQFSKLVIKVSKDKNLASFIEGEGIQVDKHISRHGFRHNFNKRISDTVDKHNFDAIRENRPHDVISEKAEADTRKYLLGHSSDKSAQVYNLRHTKETAEKLHMRAIEEVSEKIKATRNLVSKSHPIDENQADNKEKDITKIVTNN